MPRPNPRRLLVEGNEDKRVIPFFMDSFVVWGDKPAEWPVEIVQYEGVERLLDPSNIDLELKTPGLRVLGLVADADDDPGGRWVRIRSRFVGEFPEIPERVPEEGVVCSNDRGLKFGLWLMPDNRNCGMLENFLTQFVPSREIGLWRFVQDHCKSARSLHQAPFREAHEAKAQLHAWLALQDPPGQQLHLAVKSHTLRPTLPNADRFVRWFVNLYDVPLRGN